VAVWGVENEPFGARWVVRGVGWWMRGGFSAAGAASAMCGRLLPGGGSRYRWASQPGAVSGAPRGRGFPAPLGLAAACGIRSLRIPGTPERAEGGWRSQSSECPYSDHSVASWAYRAIAVVGAPAIRTHTNTPPKNEPGEVQNQRLTPSPFLKPMPLHASYPSLTATRQPTKRPQPHSRDRPVRTPATPRARRSAPAAPRVARARRW
jgi:hypothetical protein